MLVSFHTYQDVKRILAGCAVLWVIVYGVTAYYLLLQEPQRQAIVDWVPSPILRGLVQFGGLAGLGVVVGILLSYVLKLHELWDAAFTRWRLDYDIDFILPRLCWPHAAHIGPNFFDHISNSRREMMQTLFYHFVDDYKPMVRQGVIIRFYECATWFWCAQMTEALTFLFGTVALICVAAGYCTVTSGALWYITLAWMVHFIVRWASGRFFLPAVRVASNDQIREIHESVELTNELRKRIQHFTAEW